MPQARRLRQPSTRYQGPRQLSNSIDGEQGEQGEQGERASPPAGCTAKSPARLASEIGSRRIAWFVAHPEAGTDARCLNTGAGDRNQGVPTTQFVLYRVRRFRA